MDTPLNAAARERRTWFALLITALAPVIPQVLGSWFNIWYNTEVVSPLLGTPELKHRFASAVILYNAIAFPLASFIWLRLVFSLRPTFRQLCAGQTPDPDRLAVMRRRVIHLPWWGAIISGAGWLLCIPVLLGALINMPGARDPLLLLHLPISIIVSGVISLTHSFFLVELASHRALFPVFFLGETRADLTPGVVTLSLRWRGILWAVSAGICPIGSLLLLGFVPPAPGSDPKWFAVFVGFVGIAFGICTALMLSRLIARPVDHLRAAVKAVAAGRFDVRVPLPRADEFGLLIGEVNSMIGELEKKERLQQTFGLHVGRTAAEQILASDPGVGGIEQDITVVFVDIRGFTRRAALSPPPEIVGVLNEFLGVMVHIVEDNHGGMINKFLGDGFMALFGVGNVPGHAAAAVAAGREMLKGLATLNAQIAAQGSAPLAIGIGIHTGPAIVGSIGSPKRMEFTAIGSTVNIASRIESLTKTLGTPLLFSAATQHSLGNEMPTREFPAQEIRGVEGSFVVVAPA